MLVMVVIMVYVPLPEGPMVSRNSPLPTSRSISWSTGCPDRTRLSRRAVSTMLIGSSSFRGQSADARLRGGANGPDGDGGGHRAQHERDADHGDRKSTRLNSSHVAISNAVIFV